MTHIRAVNREFARFAGDDSLGLCEDKVVRCRVKRKHHHATPECQGHCGLGPVDDVAGCDLINARLQEVNIGNVVGGAVWARKNRKERTNGNVNVDVARTIQGVKCHEVGANRKVGRNRKTRFHFFASHAANAT